MSPTRAEHVQEEFGDDVRIVLDGGDCQLGLESTIVSCLEDAPRVLRPGSITLSQLRAVVPTVRGGRRPRAPRVPGSDVMHYAPRTPLSIVTSKTLEEVVAQSTVDHERVAVLAMRPPRLDQQVHDLDQCRSTRRRSMRTTCTSTCARSTSPARARSWWRKSRRRALGRGARPAAPGGLGGERRRGGPGHRRVARGHGRGQRLPMSGAPGPLGAAADGRVGRPYPQSRRAPRHAAADRRLRRRAPTVPSRSNAHCRAWTCTTR